MDFSLKINCDNDVFVEDSTAEEVARILEGVISNLREGEAWDRKLLDINGNTVGSYEFTE